MNVWGILIIVAGAVLIWLAYTHKINNLKSAL